MDVERVFHMTGGLGNTSYAQNSSLQKKASDMVKHITMESIEKVRLETAPKSMGIADLGCSSGPNTLSIIREMVDAVRGAVPEFRVYLNDLPSNDFNAIFKALPEFYRELKGSGSSTGSRSDDQSSSSSSSIYIAGYPGSFYGRLFPDKSLHFVYSSYSLHWLSRVPPGLYDEQGRSINKGKIYISESSPQQVCEAYHRQYQDDFSLFLRSRSQELITGGRTVLILLGRHGSNHVDRGNSFFWELLSLSLANLVSQGQIEEERLDSYNVHFYAPSEDEIVDEVRKEGSFEVERLEMFEIERDVGEGMSYGKAAAMTVRAIQESMICHHFGESIVDSGLFEHYGSLVDEEMGKQEIRPITFVVVLKKT